MTTSSKSSAKPSQAQPSLLALIEANGGLQGFDTFVSYLDASQRAELTLAMHRANAQQVFKAICALWPELVAKTGITANTVKKQSAAIRSGRKTI